MCVCMHPVWIVCAHIHNLHKGHTYTLTNHRSGRTHTHPVHRAHTDTYHLPGRPHTSTYNHITGAKLSKPYTSKLNSGFSPDIYIFLSYVILHIQLHFN